MKNKFPTVSIGVSVYNEENNIVNFLKSVLGQKEKGYVLKNIFVLSDGSTDNTVRLVKSLKSKKIKVLHDAKRIGKSERLNQLYSLAHTDILIQTDADVIFSNTEVISNIIKPMIQDVSVGMCGGHPEPMIAKTFTEKAVNSTFEMYAKLRKNIRGGNNIFSADGRLLAYRKKLYKQINVPHDMIANDAYTYFVCITNGFSYRYVPSAIVKFRSPQDVKDQIRQNTRFVSAAIRMGRIFDKNVVTKEYHIPLHLKIMYMAEQFVKNPTGCAYIYLVNIYCKLRAIKVEKKLNARWAVATSTKKI